MQEVSQETSQISADLYNYHALRLASANLETVWWVVWEASHGEFYLQSKFKKYFFFLTSA